MTILKNKKILVLSLWTLSFFFSECTVAADIFDLIIGTPKQESPGSRARTQRREPSASPLVSDKAPSVDERSQKTPELFLQNLPIILREMNNLEMRMTSLFPQNPLNPSNLRFGRWYLDDWRYFMAVVQGAEEPLDPTILERIKKIPSTQDLIASGLLLDVEAFKKKQSDEETNKRKQALDQAKERRKKLQRSASFLIPSEAGTKHYSSALGKNEQADEEDELQKMLRQWFYARCNPAPQLLGQMGHDYSAFNQWWKALPSELKESEGVKLLPSLMKSRHDTTGHVTNILNELLNQSLLLRAQSLYDQLLPLYLDFVTTHHTLKKLYEELEREDVALKEILNNKKLFAALEGNIISAVSEGVLPHLHKALEQTKDAELRDDILYAFKQTVQELLIERSVPYPNNNSELKPRLGNVDVEKIKGMKSDLQKIILKVVREAIDIALRQATGSLVQEEQTGWRFYSWRSTPQKTFDLDSETLTIDIAPVLQKVDKFIKPLEPKSTGYIPILRSSRGEAPPVPNLHHHSLPEDIKKLWSVSFHRSVNMKGKRWVPPKKNNDFQRTNLMMEIRGVREVPSKAFNPKSLKLSKFLIQKDIVQLMPDLPRVYTYSPGMEGSHLYPKIVDFFDQFVALMRKVPITVQITDKPLGIPGKTLTISGKTLRITGESALSSYLDPKRLSSDFYKNRRERLASRFPLLRDSEAAADWVSLEVFTEGGQHLQDAAQNKSFRIELLEHIRLLSKLEESTVLSPSGNDFTVDQLTKAAKKVLYFMIQCQAFASGKPLPSREEQQASIETSFNGKFSLNKGTQSSIERMAQRDKSMKSSQINTQYAADWSAMISFFRDLLQETLASCLSTFNVQDGTLEKLKKICNASQAGSANDPKEKLDLERHVEEVVIQLGFGVSDAADIILHVPKHINQDDTHS